MADIRWSTFTSAGVATSAAELVGLQSGDNKRFSLSATPSASAIALWDANSNLSASNLLNGYATTATNAATTTLTVASKGQQYFTGSTTQTVVLPVTSTLALGQQYQIVNNSSGVVTVQSSGLNTLQAMAAGTVLIATCISLSGTGTSSWSWSYGINAATFPLSATLGGTGIANASGSTITLGGALTTVGAFASTFTMTAPTTVTFPTSGTLATTAGTVASVSGTTNRITSTGGTTPVIDISASYVGQSSITTLGTIGTGVWQGSVIGATYGGTGVNNGSHTLTLAGNLATAGAFASTFTMTGATTVTFPTTGTLATTTNDTIIGAITQFPVAGGDAYLTGSGWLKCDGSVVSQATYASLFTKVGAAKTIGTTWTPANRTVLGATTFFGAATDGSGSLYAIFGTGGVVFSSTDLVTFTSRTSNTGSQLRCGTYATSKFVLAGAGGAVITSTDAITWSVRTSNTSSQLENVLLLNSLFVGVGAGGAVITSTDAITWVARTSGTSTGLLSVGFGNGLYFAGGTNVVIKSTDAITWSTVDTTALPNTQLSGQYQYFANKYFMASNSQVVTTSTDLVTFSQKVLAYGAPGNMNATFVSNSLLCVLSAAGIMYTTTDLVTWDWVSTSYQFTAAGISVAVDATHIVMANSNGSVNYTSGAAYSYNSATSFILPNLQSPGVFGLSVGSSFGGTLAYYIKAL